MAAPFFKGNTSSSSMQMSRDWEDRDLTSSLPKIVRGYSRLPTRKNTLPENDELDENPKTQKTGPSESLGGDPQNSKNKTNHKEPLYKFGPCFGEDLSEMCERKKVALDHVLKKTWPDQKDTSKANGKYMKAMENILEQAKNFYGTKFSEKYDNDRFMKMMMMDGCLFLQLAFLILGGPDQLGYSNINLSYAFEITSSSSKVKATDVKKWLESMFFAGNQIPMVVIKELMSQKFFKELVANKKWGPPSESALCKKALYELLLSPGQRETTPSRASDLLHSLHILIMGTSSSKKTTTPAGGTYEADDEVDLEANILGETPKLNSTTTRTFPSATDLDNSGISIKKLESGGVRSICYIKHWYWPWPTLHLPPLPTDDDDDVGMIFRNLRIYEDNQQKETNKAHKREFNSYLLFMSDLIQTSNDVNFLQRKRIIPGVSEDLDDLPDLLSSLSHKNQPLTQDFRKLRRKLRGYTGPPWARVKGILNFVAFLTLLQTVITTVTWLHDRFHIL